MAKDSEKKEIFKKILVAVDHTSRSNFTLESAVIFAKITEANIHGVYVREEYWGRLHPTATFINEFTGKIHIAESRMEQQVEAIEKRLENKLKAISHQYEIEHSWQSLRGRVIDEILKAGEEADLIIIGRRGRSSLNQKKLGSTAKAIIERSEKPVLILAETHLIGKAIIAVFDSTAESHNGLRLALSIAEKNQSQLFVVSLFKKEDAKNHNKQLKGIINSATVPINISTLAQRTIGNFIYFVKQQNPGLVIIPEEQRLLHNGSTEILLNHLKCSVLLMR